MIVEADLAISAAFEAGRAAKAIQGTAVEERKNDATPVSQADREADACIRRIIAKVFPDDAFLTEESEDDKRRLQAKRVWIIDPIDGTRAFLDKEGEWAVHIALAIDGKLALGVVGIPWFDTCMVGIPGERAWMVRGNGITIPLSVPDAPRRAVISSRRMRADARFCSAFAGIDRCYSHSVGYKAWQLSQSEARLFTYPRTLHEWDTAAPAGVLMAAGWNVGDLNGNPLRYNQEHPVSTGMSVWTHDDDLAMLREFRRLNQESAS
jgi:3'(2'), 5'-bisphosphate nucleotidase